MAVLALGVIGASIGSAIGGSFLGVAAASWGWMAGSFIGSQLQRTKLPTLYGPRLNDLTVQSSAYGNTIPIPFGRVRLAGNLIWSTGRIEHTRATEVEGGGKGGGGSSSQQQIEYYYTSSFVVALCEGPIVGVRRIWANGELIYNVSTEALGTTLVGSNLPITIYPGSETQLPSPLMESHMGVGNVPGYRGTALAEFNDIELPQKWAQNIPNLEFEVVTQGTLVGMRAAVVYTLPSSGFLEFL